MNSEIIAIGMLLLVVGIVLGRLPTVEEVNHSDAFKKRRVLNWLPLGLTYAFLYMGRYNLKVSKFVFEDMKDPNGGALMGNDDFSNIFTVGVIVYGSSFLLNGPLTDRIGGRKAILIGAGGAALANLLMALATWNLVSDGPLKDTIATQFVAVFSLLYGLNMYFQSFGAIAVVKCNAPWFHVRERGVFGAIFGILISLGIYFAYDWGYAIINGFTDANGNTDVGMGAIMVFLVPTILLVIFWVADFFVVQNSPVEAGLEDFDTADASSGDDGPQLAPAEVFKMMMSNPVILTIACIEFCSGFVRQAPMQWYRTFAKQTDVALHLKGDFIYDHWGMFLCIAGIMGGVIAGIISDRLFHSRRGPVAAILYGGVVVFSIVLYFTIQMPVIQLSEGVTLSPAGVVCILASMCVIGVHGMLSGTASMDFGGRKNVGIAVGIIDGFVYLGTGVMSFTYGKILPKEEFLDGKLTGPVTDPANWSAWPISMVIIGILGLALSTRVWNATPQKKKA